MLNDGIRGPSPESSHINILLWGVLMAPSRYELQMSAAECWGRSYHQKKRDNMLN